MITKKMLFKYVLSCFISIALTTAFTGFRGEVDPISNEDDVHFTHIVEQSTTKSGPIIYCYNTDSSYKYMGLANDFYQDKSLPIGFKKTAVLISNFDNNLDCTDRMNEQLTTQIGDGFIESASCGSINAGETHMMIKFPKMVKEEALIAWRCGRSKDLSLAWEYRVINIGESINGIWGSNTDTETTKLRRPIIQLKTNPMQSDGKEITLTCGVKDGPNDMSTTNTPALKHVSFGGTGGFIVKGDLYGRYKNLEDKRTCVAETNYKVSDLWTDLAPNDYTTDCYDSRVVSTFREIRPNFTLIISSTALFKGYKPANKVVEFDISAALLFRGVNIGTKVEIGDDSHITISPLKPRDYNTTPLIKLSAPNQTDLSVSMDAFLVAQSTRILATSLGTATHLKIIKADVTNDVLRYDCEPMVDETVVITALVREADCDIQSSDMKIPSQCDYSNGYSVVMVKGNVLFVTPKDVNIACSSMYALCSYSKPTLRGYIRNMELMPTYFYGSPVYKNDVKCVNKNASNVIARLSFNAIIDHFPGKLDLDHGYNRLGSLCGQSINPCSFKIGGDVGELDKIGYQPSIRVPIRFLEENHYDKMWKCNMFDEQSRKYSWDELKEDVACSGTELISKFVPDPIPIITFHDHEEPIINIACRDVSEDCIDKGVANTTVLTGFDNKNSNITLSRGEDHQYNLFNFLRGSIRLSCLRGDEEPFTIPTFAAMKNHEPCTRLTVCRFVKNITELYCAYNYDFCYEDDLIFSLTVDGVEVRDFMKKDVIKTPDYNTIYFKFPMEFLDPSPTTYGFNVYDKNGNRLKNHVSKYPDETVKHILMNNEYRCFFEDGLLIDVITEINEFNGDTTIKVFDWLLNFPGCTPPDVKKNATITVNLYGVDLSPGDVSDVDAREINKEIMESVTTDPIWKPVVKIIVIEKPNGEDYNTFTDWSVFTPFNERPDPNVVFFSDKTRGLFKYNLGQEKIKQILGKDFDLVYLRVNLIGEHHYLKDTQLLSSTISYRKFEKEVDLIDSSSVTTQVIRQTTDLKDLNKKNKTFNIVRITTMVLTILLTTIVILVGVWLYRREKNRDLVRYGEYRLM